MHSDQIEGFTKNNSNHLPRLVLWRTPSLLLYAPRDHTNIVEQTFLTLLSWDSFWSRANISVHILQFINKKGREGIHTAQFDRIKICSFCALKQPQHLEDHLQQIHPEWAPPSAAQLTNVGMYLALEMKVKLGLTITQSESLMQDSTRSSKYLDKLLPFDLKYWDAKSWYQIESVSTQETPH